MLIIQVPDRVGVAPVSITNPASGGGREMIEFGVAVQFERQATGLAAKVVGFKSIGNAL